MKVTCNQYESQDLGGNPGAKNPGRADGRDESTVDRQRSKLFADKGFNAVSTEAIVAAAGVTRGALYHQFDDKAALFAAVYEEVERELVADVGERIIAVGPTDHLRAMRAGTRLFLDLVSAPDVQQIVLIDAPAVLGWEKWRAVGVKYGLGVIEARWHRPSRTARFPTSRFVRQLTW